MEKKNIIIGILILLLGISLYLALQNKGEILTTTTIITPSESLRFAYEESFTTFRNGRYRGAFLFPGKSV